MYVRYTGLQLLLLNILLWDLCICHVEAFNLRRRPKMEYKAHGSNISFCPDFTLEQLRIVGFSMELAKRLRTEKSLNARAGDGNIRTGIPPNCKWYKYNDKDLLKLFE